MFTVPSTLEALDDAGVRNEVLTEEQLQMFDRLAGANGADNPVGTVLNQENDGTAWIYVTHELPAYSALQGFTDTESRRERQWLLENAHRASTDPEVTAALDEAGVQWLLVRDNTYEDEPAWLHPDDLAGAEGVELVERQGSLWLFELKA
ncbi:MAG: hypothetical protein GY812_10405 [Actinomycetia bacterium]|nr:hypothetical protein [Actinomycetes bacterium]